MGAGRQAAWLQVQEAAGLGELAAQERKSSLWGPQACRTGAPRRAGSLPLPPDSCPLPPACDHQTMGCKPGPPVLPANIGLTRFAGQRHLTPPRSPPQGHLWPGGVHRAPASSSGRDLAARRGGWGPNKVRFQFAKGGQALRPVRWMWSWAQFRGRARVDTGGPGRGNSHRVAGSPAA